MVLVSVLAVSGLTKSFGAVSVLNGVNFSVRSGERHVIIGPNGAGKTTLFNCINGLIAPDGGSVHLKETDLTRVPVFQRARLGLARTFQVTNLFAPLTVWENVTLAVQVFESSFFSWFHRKHLSRHWQDRAETLLTQFELFDKQNALVQNLSYGEQRQLEILLALAGSPTILLLDEPMAGLAAEDRPRLTQLILGLSRSISLLIIEHDIDVVFALADRVTVLHLGRVLISGSPEEVAGNSEVQEVYLGHEDAGTRG